MLTHVRLFIKNKQNHSEIHLLHLFLSEFILTQMAMKYYLIAIILLSISLSSFSQKITRQEYINRYQLLSIEEMNRSGIPASITMAQGILESGSGNSELAKRSNNHFGIKCKKGWKGKKGLLR